MAMVYRDNIKKIRTAKRCLIILIEMPSVFNVTGWRAGGLCVHPQIPHGEDLVRQLVSVVPVQVRSSQVLKSGILIVAVATVDQVFDLFVIIELGLLRSGLQSTGKLLEGL